MDQKVIIKKQNINSDLENYTKEELIQKVKSLTAHNIQLKNIIAKQSTLNTSKPRDDKPFDFSKCSFQHVALHLLYLGWDYHGYVEQEGTNETIEHYLFDALTRTKLIRDRSSSNYHRCGRTDKGVSSFGQVISIDLRVNDSSKEQLDYCKILNKVLPDTIQCIAWSSVDEQFSARFDCLSRTYKYYFPKGDLNIEKMREASSKLVGVHDFRNFCKMDVGNGVTEFTRNIMEIFIEQLEKNAGVYDICVINIKAKAFLWHQIRCIMGILFLIGEGKEEPEVIDELLNIDKYPRKPEYSMANEVPLNLYHCEYDNINWNYDLEVMQQLNEKMKKSWTFYSIKSHMIKGMIDCLEEKMVNTDESKETCLSECLHNSRTKTKKYVPLLERPTCDSLEQKIEHFKKRKRIEVIDNSS
ncbi:unnamed protein product [Phyllotreta striolata]|uniref:Pseudouridine synthase I TruA alpha/beta domain-containing protein n=1 Tax=Phyllotreta striolata TaxID=444603 RepID=A0A9N9XPY0_PHYSR|nr:unnamed protein product [Phyllotreta striolata]